MRIHATCLIAALALAGCAKAAAATVDPDNDYDCAITFDFFREAAKIQGAPDHQRQALFIMNQWFAEEWHHKNPNLVATADDEMKIVNVIARDPMSYKDVMKTCAERAAADPRFNKFAALMQQNAPDAR